MEKPENSPSSIHQMMLHCWDNEPTQRPSFNTLMDELGDLLEEGERDHYLDLTKRFDAIGKQANAVENKDYLGMMSPPDFATQTSVSPAPLEEEDDGYLAPKPFNFDKDDYLMPNGVQSIEMTKLNGSASAMLV